MALLLEYKVEVLKGPEALCPHPLVLYLPLVTPCPLPQVLGTPTFCYMFLFFHPVGFIEYCSVSH